MFAPRRDEFLDVAVLTVGKKNATALGKEGRGGELDQVSFSLSILLQYLQLSGPLRFTSKISPPILPWRLDRL